METEDGVTGAVKAFFKHLPSQLPSRHSPPPSSSVDPFLGPFRRCLGCLPDSWHLSFLNLLLSVPTDNFREEKKKKKKNLLYSWRWIDILRAICFLRALLLVEQNRWNFITSLCNNLLLVSAKCQKKNMEMLLLQKETLLVSALRTNNIGMSMGTDTSNFIRPRIQTGQVYPMLNEYGFEYGYKR